MATESYFVKLLKYAAIGIAVVPLSIVTHELGHFLFYYLFGADNVQLHSVSVSADKDALSNLQKAIVNIVGPIISYLTIALAFFFYEKKIRSFLGDFSTRRAARQNREFCVSLFSGVGLQSESEFR